MNRQGGVVVDVRSVTWHDDQSGVSIEGGVGDQGVVQVGGDELVARVVAYHELEAEIEQSLDSVLVEETRDRGGNSRVFAVVGDVVNASNVEELKDSRNVLLILLCDFGVREVVQIRMIVCVGLPNEAIEDIALHSSQEERVFLETAQIDLHCSVVVGECDGDVAASSESIVGCDLPGQSVLKCIISCRILWNAGGRHTSRSEAIIRARFLSSSLSWPVASSYMPVNMNTSSA